LKNLVIGSAGFVGRPLCTYLRGLGEQVTEFDIRNNPAEDARSAHLPLDGIDRTYLLAWDVGGAKYLYNPNNQVHQLDWNLRLLQNTMPQLRGTQFLFVSSQLAEVCSTVYGATKRLGEHWALLNGGSVVRLWNVYGVSEVVSERSHVISDLVQQARTGGKIQLLTDGSERRQFVHVDDACRAFHLALDNNIKEIYDVTSNEWISINRVANMIADLTGTKVIKGHSAAASYSQINAMPLPEWHPTISLKDGLMDLLRHV